MIVDRHIHDWGDGVAAYEPQPDGYHIARRYQCGCGTWKFDIVRVDEGRIVKCRSVYRYPQRLEPSSQSRPELAGSLDLHPEGSRGVGIHGWRAAVRAPYYLLVRAPYWLVVASSVIASLWMVGSAITVDRIAGRFRPQEVAWVCLATIGGTLVTVLLLRAFLSAAGRYVEDRGEQEQSDGDGGRADPDGRGRVERSSQ